MSSRALRRWQCRAGKSDLLGRKTLIEEAVKRLDAGVFLQAGSCKVHTQFEPTTRTLKGCSGDGRQPHNLH